MKKQHDFTYIYIFDSRFIVNLFSVAMITDVQSSLAQASYTSNLELIFSQIFLTNRASIKPIKFYTNCIPPWFQRGQQQDSSEYLMFLLDSLNEELKTSSEPSLVENLFGIITYDKNVSFPSFLLHISFKRLQNTNRVYMLELFGENKACWYILFTSIKLYKWWRTKCSVTFGQLF